MKRSGLMPSRLAGMNSNFKPNNIDRACLGPTLSLKLSLYTTFFMCSQVRSVCTHFNSSFLIFNSTNTNTHNSLERSLDELDLVQHPGRERPLRFGRSPLQSSHRFMHWRPIYPGFTRFITDSTYRSEDIGA